MRILAANPALSILLRALPLLSVLPMVAAGCGDSHPACSGDGCLKLLDAGAPDARARPQPGSGDAGLDQADDDARFAPPPPSIPPFEVGYLDLQSAPCDDFYQFACGGWIRKNPLRTGERSRSTYGSWSAGVWDVVRQAIDDAVAERLSGTSPEATAIGNYYQACMDAENQPASRALLRPVIDLVDGVATIADLARVNAELRRRGVSTFFTLYAGIDPGASNRYILTIDQGARRLPSRHHYFEPGYGPAREAYLVHIQRLAELMGVVIDPQAVLRVETALAQGELTPAEKRDPLAIYNKLPFAEAVALAGSFPWRAHLDALGLGPVTELNVISKGALRAVETVLTTASIADLKHYLRWQVLDDKAALLDKAVLDEEFAFHGRVLSGATSASSRRAVCLTRTRSRYPFHLSKRYVERYFPAGARQEATLLVKSVREAFRRRLQANTWLDEATRNAALAKLAAMGEKIGHPVPLPTITKAPPMRTLLEEDLEDSFAGIVNALAPTAVVNRGAWFSDAAPININAFYHRSRNDINLPAAVLYLPHFDLRRSPAANYGAIGRTIGHEITHGFDDAGRLYDELGSLRPWWTPMVDAEFRTRAQCVGDRWGKFEAQPGQFIDPTLTMGENIADLDGTRLAFEAFVHDRPVVEPYMGYSDRQQFFLANAQARCSVQSPDFLAELLKTDPHSPDRARVNLTLSEMPEFAETWNCPAGSRMRVAPACKIW